VNESSLGATTIAMISTAAFSSVAGPQATDEFTEREPLYELEAIADEDVAAGDCTGAELDHVGC
jgi:hypothetical protein